MVKKCQTNLSRDNSNIDFEVVNSSIEDINISNASIVILNFTLQFIEPAKRDDIIQKIYDGLIPGGALILSEKFKFDDREKNDQIISHYYDFKRANGYSDLEISQKRDALEDVLIIDSKRTHLNRLLNSNFTSIDNWFTYLNFTSYLAVK